MAAILQNVPNHKSSKPDMKKQSFSCFLLLSLLLSFQLSAQPIPGPRTTKDKAVRLTPVPINASPAEIQALLEKNKNVYFKPGTYNIGTLRINNWRDGLIWGAGRLTTTLQGNIIINNIRNLTIGNFNLINNGTAKGQSVIDLAGESVSRITFMNALVSGGNDGIALRLKAPGQFMVQGCYFNGNDVGLSIEHPRAIAHVFGGNMQSNGIHIQQIRGHLDARAFGMQISRSGADIVVHSPSPTGYHLLEGIRTEGSEGANSNEVMLRVPQTPAPVNIALRANTMGSMTHYADYGAAGTLLLLENANYPGPDDKNSVGVMVHSNHPARVISLGNQYGLSYDSAQGPFIVGPKTTVQSMGDLWMLPNQTDYYKPFNEPITEQSLVAAGKILPKGASFLKSTETLSLQLPDFSDYEIASFPVISNLGELMLNVKDFGAVPNDGKDDRDAIQKALDAAEKGGIYEPLFFPAGQYDLNAPLFFDHLAGGGFWGEGATNSVLVSTSGKGVIMSDGAGYSVFVDIGFVNKAGAETKTTDFDWVTSQSADKKRGNTGAALQANMFYRDRFENGGIGLAVGAHQMGDGFLMVDCVFKNQRTAKGEGAAYSSENFNALTNPLVHCLFENVDCAVSNQKGSFNFYGNKLINVHTAALKFYAIVSDGFAIVNNEMDSSQVPLVVTGHSSAKAHLLIERTRVGKTSSTAVGSAYTLGGSVLFLRSALPNRVLSNGGGIGDNTLLVYETPAADVKSSGRAHLYLINTKKKNN